MGLLIISMIISKIIKSCRKKRTEHHFKFFNLIGVYNKNNLTDDRVMATVESNNETGNETEVIEEEIVMINEEKVRKSSSAKFLLLP